MDLQNELRRRSRRRRLLAARRYRSRRFWRTISRRRRAISIFVLAALISLTVAAFYFMRPQRVEQLAEEYLTQLAQGRQVRIGHAKFSPFEGIRLQNLRVLPPGLGSDEKDAIFKAQEVLLELEPGSLLAGRLKVRRIVAVKPELYSRESGEARQPSYLQRELSKGGWDVKLPVIELREGRFIQYSRITEPQMEIFETSVTAELRPDPSVPDLYRIAGRIGRSSDQLIPFSGKLTLNPFTLETNTPVVVRSVQQLPGQIEQVLARYGINTAKVKIEGKYNALAGELLVTFNCQGTQMTLPLSDLPRDNDAAKPTAAPPGGGKLKALRFTDVRGLIVVAVRNSSPEAPDAAGGWFAFQGVKGLLNGQPFEIDGRFNGLSLGAPFDLRLASPRLEVPRDPATVAELPAKIQDVLDNYQPGGTVAIEVELHRAQADDTVQVKGKVTCLDVSASYWRFPYKMDHVAGTVSFDNHEAQIDLLAKRGDTTVTVKGTAGLGPNRPQHLAVLGKGVPFNEETIKALKEQHSEYVDVLHRLRAAGGTVDFDCTVEREDKPKAPVATALTIDLHDMGVCYEKFNYPARIKEGRLRLVGDGMELRGFQVRPAHLTAADASAVLLMDGYYGQDDEGEADVKLEWTAGSFPVDETLMRAIAGLTTEKVLQLRIDSRVSMVGAITQRPKSPLTFDIRGQLKGGFAKYDAWPYALEGLSGEVHVTPDLVELKDGKGSHGTSTVSIAGQMALADNQETKVAIRSDRLPLDDDLFAALPKDIKETWKRVSPTGSVGLDVMVNQAKADPKKGRPPASPVIAVTALGNGLTLADFPYPLSHVTGQVVIRPDRIELKDLLEEHQGRKIKLSGTIWPDRDNLNLPSGQAPLPKLDLAVSAEGMNFDEPLRRAVPWRMRRQWNDILPTGGFDLALKQLRYTPLGTTGRWDVEGRLEVRNGSGQLGVDLERVTGQIAGRGTVVVGQATGFVGKIALSEATVSGRPLTAVSGSILQDARTGQLRIEDLAGRLYGGQVTGFAQVGLSDKAKPWAIRLGCVDLDLAQLVNGNRPAAERWDVAGRLDGSVGIEGKLSDGSRKGRGQVLLSRAQIYRMPAVVQMFGDAKKPRPPLANQSANIVFFLDGQRVLFDEANLRDPTTSLLGAGTMDLSSKKMDMTFVAGEPSAGAHKGAWVLEELLSGAGEELMRYHMTGTLDKPKVEAVPLHTVREAIEELARARRQYKDPKQARNAAAEAAAARAIAPRAPAGENGGGG